MKAVPVGIGLGDIGIGVKNFAVTESGIAEEVNDRESIDRTEAVWHAIGCGGRHAEAHKFQKFASSV